MSSREYESFYQELLASPKPVDLAVDAIRTNFELKFKAFPPDPSIRFETLSIGEIPAVWAFAPEVNRKRILLFFFGGGFGIGSIESHKNLIGRLSAVTNAAVLAIQYRLAPENPFPAALEDALSAYRWLLHHPYARSRIVFSGLSAGANLALSLCLKLKLEKIAMPAGLICLCPWSDLTANLTDTKKDVLSPQSIQRFAEYYYNGKDSKNPLISPIFGDFGGLPPLFIQTGTHDLIHTQALQLAKKAEKDGMKVQLDVWPNMIHGWQMYAPKFPEAQEALEKAGEFVDKVFTDKSGGAGH